jgi:hypothetical protein
MDSDDPIYRQYFRFINDNLKYPIRDNYNETVDPPIFDELLDRIVIDRRIHISPPGETTQYIIKEIYNTTNLDETNAYLKAIEYAKEICITSSPIDSEILLFCTTENKIIKLVDELNKVLPANVIAIPFYTKLPEESKTMITSNLKEIKNTWKFPKQYVHDVLNQIVKLSAVNSTYKYDRILVVSTNIAEASITIETLKFVIETGFNNDVSYNYKTGTTNVNIVPITESSRLQRKGRIGRRSNGTIYYTYKKDARKDVKPLYPICKTNFSDTFLNFMEEQFEIFNIYEIQLYPFSIKLLQEYNNDYVYLYIQKFDEEISKTNKVDPIVNKNYRNLFYILIKNQFLTITKISDNVLFRNDLNNINLINENMYNNIIPFVRTGIRTIILIDPELKFYLIHPFENEIKKYRNKNTRLVIKQNIDEISIKIRDIFEKNIYKTLIQNLYVYNEIEIFQSINKSKEVSYKSKIVEYLNKLKQNTDKFIELNLLYPITVSSKFNILDNVLFIVYFLKESSNDIFNVIENIEKFNNMFSSKESDLLVINKIYDLFKTTFGHLILEVSIDNKKIELINKFQYLYSNFLNNSKIEKDYYNLIIKHILKNNDYETFSESIANDLNEVEINLEKKNKNDKNDNDKKIKNWCNIYGIKYEIFNKIINTFKYRYFQYKMIFENNNKKKEDYLQNSLFQNELTIDKNIIKSFMYGNLDKIFFVEGANNYKNTMKYNLLINYKKNTFNKKWISKVIDNKFLLVLNLDNEILFNKNNQINENPEENETNNKVIILTNISAISNKLYSNIMYIGDNPTLNSNTKVNDIANNFICNNPININHFKNSLDPKFNEYINRLQNSIADYIERYC